MCDFSFSGTRIPLSVLFESGLIFPAYLVLTEKPVIVIFKICLFLLEGLAKQINEVNKIDLFNFLTQMCQHLVL